jgi:hypothetical protein
MAPSVARRTARHASDPPPGRWNGTPLASALDLDTKETVMRLWKPQLALALAAAAALAMAVVLFDRRGVVNVLLMILIGAALVGMYLLRRYARAELLYLRHADTEPRTASAEPAPVRTDSATGRGDPTGSGPPAARAHADQRSARS